MYTRGVRSCESNSSRRTAELAEMKKQLEKHALDVEALVDTCPCCYCDDRRRVPSVWLAFVDLIPAWGLEPSCRQPFRGQSDRLIALNEGICEGNANPDLRNWEVECLILSAYAIHPLSFYEECIFELC